MGTQYCHLCEADRLTIQSMLALGLSFRRIAARLGVSPSTISREVERGSGRPFGYQAHVAQGEAVARRRRASRFRRKLGSDIRSPLWRVVRRDLRAGWSPQQIAGRLRLMHPKPQSLRSLTVSHETIYCAIYAMPRGSLRTELVKLLRKSHRGRLPRGMA
jgi:transposase, IS30 family